MIRSAWTHFYSVNTMIVRKSPLLTKSFTETLCDSVSSVNLDTLRCKCARQKRPSSWQ